MLYLENAENILRIKLGQYYLMSECHVRAGGVAFSNEVKAFTSKYIYSCVPGSNIMIYIQFVSVYSFGMQHVQFLKYNQI